jgi:hypothetical protein
VDWAADGTGLIRLDRKRRGRPLHLAPVYELARPDYSEIWLFARQAHCSDEGKPRPARIFIDFPTQSVPAVNPSFASFFVYTKTQSTIPQRWRPVLFFRWASTRRSLQSWYNRTLAIALSPPGCYFSSQFQPEPDLGRNGELAYTRPKPQNPRPISVFAHLRPLIRKLRLAGSKGEWPSPVDEKGTVEPGISAFLGGPVLRSGIVWRDLPQETGSAL